MFFQEYGQCKGNEIYGQWIDKYQALWREEKKDGGVDDFIIERELEPKYKKRILLRFKNRKNLFSERFDIERDRYYNVPEPLNYIDWRTPYDNIFVWEESGKKVAKRGGSGSSGSRETNSIFIFALLEVNKIKPVPSYLFLYSQENELLFIKKFANLCVPIYDLYQTQNKQVKFGRGNFVP
jgi:hypothetical protein